MIVQEEALQKAEKPKITNRSILQIALTFLGASAFPILYMTARHELSWLSGSFFFLCLLWLNLDCVPPFKLNQRGWGEIMRTILFGGLIPGFAFFYKPIHRPNISYLQYYLYPLFSSPVNWDCPLNSLAGCRMTTAKSLMEPSAGRREPGSTILGYSPP